MSRKSAMELVDDVQTSLNALREVLSGDRAGWSWERHWYELLKAFVDDGDTRRELDYAERRAAAQRAGFDMRVMSGAFKKRRQDGQFEWVAASGKARLTDSGLGWHKRLRSAHPDW